MKKKIKLILCFLSLILVSCHFSATFQDEVNERDKAQDVVDSMYNNVNLRDLKKAAFFFADEFYAVTNESQLYEIFAKTRRVLGDYKSKTLISWKTARVEGDNPSSEYLLVYSVTYAKYKANETFRLKKDKGVVRIISYNVNSEGFLK